MVRLEMVLLRSIKHVAPEAVSMHCVIHREALVVKKLGNEEEITN